MEAKTERFAVMRRGEDDFLPVFVEENDLDGAGEDDIGALAGLSDFVDALLGGELADLYLRASTLSSSSSRSEKSGTWRSSLAAQGIGQTVDSRQ